MNGDQGLHDGRHSRTRERAIVAVIVLVSLMATGCMNTRTRGMVERCQSLLEARDATASRVFIKEAEEHLAASKEPPGRWRQLVANLQDEGAHDARPELEQCLWLLKYRQAP